MEDPQAGPRPNQQPLGSKGKSSGKGKGSSKGGSKGGGKGGKGDGGKGSSGKGCGGKGGSGGGKGSPSPPLRLLCLHGGRQNADIFRERLDGLCKRCRHGLAELSFVDGPHELLVPGDTATTRGWMSDDPESLPATLAFLEQQWSSATFDGVIGFSQGASAAAAMAARPARFPGLRVAIVACCPAAPLPDDAGWGGDAVRLPAPVASLHVWSAQDGLVPMEDSEALQAVAFEGAPAETAATVEPSAARGHAAFASASAPLTACRAVRACV
jgi:dienelactone hydrolase